MSARPHLDRAERRRRMGWRHRLATDRHSDDVATVADALVGLHSSDPTTVFLSAAARLRSPAIGPIEDALYVERTLIRHHAMRRTIWVMTVDIARIAHAATTLKIAEQERRRLISAAADSGYDDPIRWLDDMSARVLDALADGPATARHIGERHPDLRAPLTLGAGSKNPSIQPAHTRLLQLLGVEGRAVRAWPTTGWTTSQYHWAQATDWRPNLFTPVLAVDDAQAALADRWLRTFGPASLSDLQWWTGWNKSDTTRALAACGAVEATVDDGDRDAWVAADDVEPTADPGHWVALLPGLDPTLMGWKARDWYLDPALVPDLFDRNGNAGACVMVDGAVVGGWAQRADGHIAVKLHVDVGREVAEEIVDAAHDLQDVLGEARFRPRFPAPIQRELTGG